MVVAAAGAVAAGLEQAASATQTRTAKFREWVCPECDYFEEAEEG